MTERDWQAFVIAHGWRARGDHLAAVVGQSEAAIARVRLAGCTRLAQPKAFGELFALWHGRSPREDEWPAPRRIGGGYEWLAPELALLARLVGTTDKATIARALTDRLRTVTGDPTAARGLNHVQIRTNKIGLQLGTDITGGLTTRAAAMQAGGLARVNTAIATGHLRTFRLGKRHVIPRAEFDRWLSGRGVPPAGWVRLASLCEPLGISSDSKLPEYASLGHIPDVVKVAGIGTMRGVWYIAPERARQILDDARAGRPLPWHGKPLPGNQLAMWNKWQRRKHRGCRRCSEIWRGAAPKTFEAFCARYAELSIGEKRHLTNQGLRRKTTWRPWGTSRGHRSAGLTVAQAARALQQPPKWIRSLIRGGLFETGGILRDALGGEAVRITPVGMAMLRGVADGQAAAAARGAGDWMGVHEAALFAGVCITTVHRWRAIGDVRTRRGPRGILFDRASIEQRARTFWAWAMKRYTRPTPPAWLTATSEAA